MLPCVTLYPLKISKFKILALKGLRMKKKLFQKKSISDIIIGYISISIQKRLCISFALNNEIKLFSKEDYEIPQSAYSLNVLPN